MKLLALFSAPSANACFAAATTHTGAGFLCLAAAFFPSIAYACLATRTAYSCFSTATAQAGFA
jgi:hypothetical protein